MVGKLAFAFDARDFSDMVLEVRLPGLAPVAQPAPPSKRASKRLKAADGSVAGSSSGNNFQVAFKLHVNRLTLAAASEVFRRKLQAWKAAPGEPVAIDILPGQEALFRQLLKFIYTEELEASTAEDEKELLQMLLLANYFAVDDCAVMCASLLDQKDLSLDMCVEICKVASEQAHCEALATNAHRRIMAKFGDFDRVQNDVILMRQFLTLPFPVVEALVAKDTLRVAVENTVFSVVTTWLEHNGGTAAQLSASQLRYPYMMATYLRGVVAENSFFTRMPNHATIMLDAMTYKATFRDLQKEVAADSGMWVPRQHYARSANIKSDTYNIKVPVSRLAAMKASL